MAFEYPKSRSENIKFRLNLIEKAENDKTLQALILKECEKNVHFFIDCFCWTFDPRGDETDVPFILYPRQTDLIDLLNYLLARSRLGEKINLIIDKPRAVGATFTVMAWVLHHFLFDSYTARIGSRKEDYVDKMGEPDTLFYKIDYMYDRLPAWMKVKRTRANMIIGRENTNQISGESANPNFSRGGRKSAVIFDELAFWEWARSSWESSGESTNLRIALSTPPEAGKDSFFYKLRTGQAGKTEVFEFTWKDVPSRDEDWLRQAKETKSDEEFAREVLKSYEGTTSGKVYAKSLRLATIGSFEYDPSLPLFCSWDFGLDEVAIIWVQKDVRNNRCRIIDSYRNSDKEIDFYVPFITGDIESGTHDYTETDLDVIQRHKSWTKSITHYGDPDVKKRSLITKESTRDALQKHGIYVQSKAWSGRSWKELRDKTQMLFRRLDIDEKRNEYFLSCIRSAKYPEKRENSQSTQEIQKPVHDFCVSGDTKIRTLGGWKEIRDISAGEYVWGYSIAEHRLKPARIEWAGMTRKNAELIEIGLDNGKVIKCTPDHRFMLRDESYIEARDLHVGESLMPFYELNDGGYISVDLNDGTSAMEHRFVFNTFIGKLYQDYHVDHVNGDHFDNNPNNLRLLLGNEHCSKTFRGTNKNGWGGIDKTNYSREFYGKSQSYKICPNCGSEFRGDWRKMYCSKECKRIEYNDRNSPENRIKKDPAHAEVRKKACKTFEEKHKHKCAKCDNLCYRRATLCSKCVRNHKIRYIKLLDTREDTYDLEVPELSNFVAEGVVIHNSSHFRTSLEYWADNEPELGRQEHFKEDIKKLESRLAKKYMPTRKAKLNILDERFVL